MSDELMDILKHVDSSSLEKLEYRSRAIAQSIVNSNMPVGADAEEKQKQGYTWNGAEWVK